MSQREKDFLGQVSQVRRRYKKLKSAKKWGAITDVLDKIPLSGTQLASLVIKSQKETHGPKTGRTELKERAGEVTV